MKKKSITGIRPVRAFTGGLAAAGIGAAILAGASPAHADGGWVAVAGSPSHEQLDWAWGIDQRAAESEAMAQCALLQRARNCRLLATGPDCVAIAWDADEPINHAHGRSGGGREVVLRAAISAAGPYANDHQVRCSSDYANPL